MEFYLKEAFKSLKLLESNRLDEEDFNLTADQGVIDELQSFVTDDIEAPAEEEIIDVEADKVEDLQDNYVGKVILECDCCHTRIYKDIADVIIDEETGLANVEEECPVCSNAFGWNVIGKIEPFKEGEFDEEEPVEVDVTEEEPEITDDEIGEALKEALNEDKCEEECTDEECEDCDESCEDKKVDEDFEDPNKVGVDPDHAVEDDEKLETKFENPIKESLNEAQPTQSSIIELDRNIGEIAGRIEDLERDLSNSRRRDHRKIAKLQDPIWNKYKDDPKAKFDSWPQMMMDGTPYTEIDHSWNGWLNRDELLTPEEKAVADEVDKMYDDSDAKHRANYNELHDLYKQLEILNKERKNIRKSLKKQESLEKVQSEDAEKLEDPKDDPVKDLKEDLNEVEVHTDNGDVNVSKEDSKVTIDFEPTNEEVVETEDEMIAPLDAEEINEIENNEEQSAEEVAIEDEMAEEPVEGEEDELDIDEFDEESFDEMGESYLHRVYENVDSFKTSKVSYNDKKLVVEGAITFKSGKEKTTSFVFENLRTTKRGKVISEGLNETFSKSKRAFVLRGSLVDGKFIGESLTYNYNVKQLNESNESEVVRVYGRAITKK